jgi:hypothetical protein
MLVIKKHLFEALERVHTSLAIHSILRCHDCLYVCQRVHHIHQMRSFGRQATCPQNPLLIATQSQWPLPSCKHAFTQNSHSPYNMGTHTQHTSKVTHTQAIYEPHEGGTPRIAPLISYMAVKAWKLCSFVQLCQIHTQAGQQHMRALHTTDIWPSPTYLPHGGNGCYEGHDGLEDHADDGNALGVHHLVCVAQE